MSAIGKRLEKLEDGMRPDGGVFLVWRDQGETREQAIARRFGSRPVPAGATLYVVSWQWPEAQAA